METGKTLFENAKKLFEEAEDKSVVTWLRENDKAILITTVDGDACAMAWHGDRMQLAGVAKALLGELAKVSPALAMYVVENAVTNETKLKALENMFSVLNEGEGEEE